MTLALTLAIVLTALASACGRRGFSVSDGGAGNRPPVTPAIIRPAIGGSVVDATPGLSANFDDPDAGDSGTLELEICKVAVAVDAACGSAELVASCTTLATARGDAGTCSPVSGLPAHGTYYVRARATDVLGLSSEWSAARAFRYRAAPHLVHVDGFEHGLGCNAADRFGLYSANTRENGGTLLSSSAITRSGSFSLRVHQTSAEILGCDVVPATGPTAERALRVAVYIDVAPPTVGFDPDVIDLSGAGGWHGSINLVGGTNPYLRAHFIGGPIANGPSVQAGRWYLIEMYTDLRANTWTLDWRVDGIDQPRVSHAAGAPATTNDILLGVTRANAVGTVIHFDDLVVSATSADYPLGDGAVLGHAIDEIGSHAAPENFEETIDGAAWSALSGSDWARLSDIPVQRTGSFGAVRQLRIDATAFLEYQLADPAIDASDPNGLTPVVFTRASSSGSNKFSLRLWDGTTEAIIANAASTANGVDLHSWYLGQPVAPSGAPWTATELSALRLRFGYATELLSIPQLDAAMVQVDYPR